MIRISRECWGARQFSNLTGRTTDRSSTFELFRATHFADLFFGFYTDPKINWCYTSLWNDGTQKIADLRIYVGVEDEDYLKEIEMALDDFAIQHKDVLTKLPKDPIHPTDEPDWELASICEASARAYEILTQFPDVTKRTGAAYNLAVLKGILVPIYFQNSRYLHFFLNNLRYDDLEYLSYIEQNLKRFLEIVQGWQKKKKFSRWVKRSYRRVRSIQWKASKESK